MCSIQLLLYQSYTRTFPFIYLPLSMLQSSFEALFVCLWMFQFDSAIVLIIYVRCPAACTTPTYVFSYLPT